MSSNVRSYASTRSSFRKCRGKGLLPGTISRDERPNKENCVDGGMIMKKKIILSLLCLVLLLYSLSLSTGITTLVIPLSEYKIQGHPGIKKGQIVNPLQRLDFEKGKWAAYLVVNPADRGDLNPAFKKASCYRSDDVELFNRMKKKWDFTYTSGDVATVSSALYFVRDGKIEFESGIVLDKNREGLQNGEYGWLEPVVQQVLSGHLRHFKRVYWPVVIF
jgi:hypothetical protein